VLQQAAALYHKLLAVVREGLPVPAPSNPTPVGEAEKKVPAIVTPAVAGPQQQQQHWQAP